MMLSSAPFAAGHAQQQCKQLAAGATSAWRAKQLQSQNNNFYSPKDCEQRQQPWRQHLQQQQQQQQQQHLPHQQRTTVMTAAKGFGSVGKTTSKAATRGAQKCPCGSGKQYQSCCGRYHSGAALAPTPEALLRARYSAYTLQLVDYLVATTHKENPEHTGDPITYARSVQRTARGTEYLGLTLLDLPTQQQQPADKLKGETANPGNGDSSGSSSSTSSSSEQGQEEELQDAYLKFSVKWRQRSGGSEELSTEVSHFKRVNGAWLYYAMVE